jgi:hypothetical protein
MTDAGAVPQARDRVTDAVPGSRRDALGSDGIRATRLLAQLRIVPASDNGGTLSNVIVRGKVGRPERTLALEDVTPKLNRRAC